VLRQEHKSKEIQSQELEPKARAKSQSESQEPEELRASRAGDKMVSKPTICV